MSFVFDTYTPDSPYVEQVWRTHSERAGRFTSVAINTWELVVTRIDNETTVTARGPETRASPADFPADADYFGIAFKLGTFMPRLPIKTLRDRQDFTLPKASSRHFWLNGSAWEVPTFEHADVFVHRLVRQGLLEVDPAVVATLQGQPPDLAPRTLQYRFVRATGLTRQTIYSIERAHRAVSLLEAGTLIKDAAFALGYFDQSHLTSVLKRLIGETPAQILKRAPR